MLTSLDIEKLETKFVSKRKFIADFGALMYELKAIRDELTMGTYRRSENSDAIEKHEARITEIERKIAF